MKNIFLLALALLTFQANAQEQKREMRKAKMEAAKKMTAEEIATIQTKKLTLHLDLDKSQQDKVYNIHLEQAKKRKAKMEKLKALKEKGKDVKPDRYKMMNDRLDAQIALKKQFKEILTPDQYKKWEASNDSKRSKRIRAQKMKKMKSKPKY